MITNIPTPIKSWIIALGIRRQRKDTPYSRFSFCNEFSDMIERDFNVTKNRPIVIQDFNIHMDTPTESDAIIFIDLLEQPECGK